MKDIVPILCPIQAITRTHDAPNHWRVKPLDLWKYRLLLMKCELIQISCSIYEFEDATF